MYPSNEYVVISWFCGCFDEGGNESRPDNLRLMMGHLIGSLFSLDPEIRAASKPRLPPVDERLLKTNELIILLRKAIWKQLDRTPVLCVLDSAHVYLAGSYSAEFREFVLKLAELVNREDREYPFKLLITSNGRLEGAQAALGDVEVGEEAKTTLTLPNCILKDAREAARQGLRSSLTSNRGC